MVKHPPHKASRVSEHIVYMKVKNSSLKLTTFAIAPSSGLSAPRTPPTSRHVSGGVKPCVMFTGIRDEEGERTVKKLVGEMVDSVYQCTHLVTDKVRRTVKFLCCLSRGSLIVSSNWLSESALAGHILPAEPFFIKDPTLEKQFNFSLVK